MLDRLIRHMRGRSGVRFTTMIEVAQQVRPHLIDGAGLAGAGAPREGADAAV
jgi:hypothetical protein